MDKTKGMIINKAGEKPCHVEMELDPQEEEVAVAAADLHFLLHGYQKNTPIYIILRRKEGSHE